MRRLLFEDVHHIENFESNARIYLESVNNVAKEFDSLNLDAEMSIELLGSIIGSPLGAINDILKSKIPDYTQEGIIVNKDSVMECTRIPNIKNLKGLCERINTADIFYELLEVKGNKIIYDELRYNQKLDAFRYYSENEKTLKYYDQLKDLEKKLNKLNDTLHLTIDKGLFIESIFNFNHKTKIKLNRNGFIQLVRKHS